MGENANISASYQKQIVLLQMITVVWMCAEAGIAVFGAIRAHSMALLGFGADSVIELISAVAVLLRFTHRAHIDETRATRITGWLLFMLGVFVAGGSIISLTNPRFRPKPSYLGIALLIVAAIAMPWISSQKRALAEKSHSSSLKADAMQSSMCGYLAWISLGGLVLNALFKMFWADPVAALLLLPILGKEGWEALHGKGCSDCSCS